MSSSTVSMSFKKLAVCAASITAPYSGRMRPESVLALISVTGTPEGTARFGCPRNTSTLASASAFLSPRLNGTGAPPSLFHLAIASRSISWSRFTVLLVTFTILGGSALIASQIDEAHVSFTLTAPIRQSTPVSMCHLLASSGTWIRSPSRRRAWQALPLASSAPRPPWPQW